MLNNSFYLTPIVFNSYNAVLPKLEFLKELRRNTREPYFDNRNSRRLDKNQNLIFADEFDNFIFLKCTITDRVTFKTLLYVREKNSALKVLSVSYPGGFGGLFYYGFCLCGGLFVGIKSLVLDGDFYFLLAFIVLYIICVINVHPDFIKQNKLVKRIVDKLNRDENTIQRF